jgi:hypothetical protein
MQSNSGIGRTSFGDETAFNGVKIFSATMVADRERLGEKLTDWLTQHPRLSVREIIVTQSSDEAFHCLAITVFYWEELG